MGLGSQSRKGIEPADTIGIGERRNRSAQAAARQIGGEHAIEIVDRRRRSPRIAGGERSRHAQGADDGTGRGQDRSRIDGDRPGGEGAARRADERCPRARARTLSVAASAPENRLTPVAASRR